MSEVSDRAAEEFLAAAYPDPRQRVHAERWLGLLACQAADGEPVRWWQIPALAPAQAVLTVRGLILCAVAGAVIGWGIYIGLRRARPARSAGTWPSWLWGFGGSWRSSWRVCGTRPLGVLRAWP